LSPVGVTCVTLPIETPIIFSFFRNCLTWNKRAGGGSGVRFESLLVYKIHEVHKGLEKYRLKSVCNIWNIHSTAVKNGKYVMYDVLELEYWYTKNRTQIKFTKHVKHWESTENMCF
jgi:hypothetical protein